MTLENLGEVAVSDEVAVVVQIVFDLFAGLLMAG